MAIPLVPPICPTCGVACLQEFSTPAVGSGVVSERNYCPSCGWNPEHDLVSALIEEIRRLRGHSPAKPVPDEGVTGGSEAHDG